MRSNLKEKINEVYKFRQNLACSDIIWPILLVVEVVEFGFRELGCSQTESSEFSQIQKKIN
jgi:hypothetical protein